MKGLKNFILDKLFFPKIAVIDKPGIITSKTSVWYSKHSSPKRMVYIFEKIISDLMNDTRQQIGEQKTNDLFYCIGKKQVARYISVGKMKAPSKVLRKDIIEHVLDVFKSGGAHAAESYYYDEKKNQLTLTGKNNLFCRYSRIGSYVAGGTSMFMSFLCNQQIESRAECESCPDKCRIITNPAISPKLKVSVDKLESDYYVKNFPGDVKTDGFPSFSELVRFNEIIIDQDGMYLFRSDSVSPCEIGWLELCAHEYEEQGLISLFKKSIISSSKKAAKIFKNDDKAILRTLAAFGWGLPYLKNQQLIIKYPPFTKYGNSFMVTMLSGLFYETFGNNLTAVKYSVQPYALKLLFS